MPSGDQDQAANRGSSRLIGGKTSGVWAVQGLSGSNSQTRLLSTLPTVTAIFDPSGDQMGALRLSRASLTAWRFPPSASTIQIWNSPVRFDGNARRFPSGDQLGRRSAAAS